MDKGKTICPSPIRGGCMKNVVTPYMNHLAKGVLMTESQYTLLSMNRKYDNYALNPPPSATLFHTNSNRCTILKHQNSHTTGESNHKKDALKHK